MGFKTLDLKMPTDYGPEELKQKIAKKLRIKNFTFTIDKKSLDGRQKGNILWTLRLGVSSPQLKGSPPPPAKQLTIPFKKRNQKVLVVGSGPAGFFAAYTLLLAGFQVTLTEQGPDVKTRARDISLFETSGTMKENSNYAFGEGGAGTFSDGKLTSRTKTISMERAFIFDTYIQHGAPPEIAYLAHPHLGSDNLTGIIQKLRNNFQEKGGVFLFDTPVTKLETGKNTVKTARTPHNSINADYFIFAPGHSAYPTYRMLMEKGVPFKTKPFAVGCRVEHPQELINLAQWGQESLPGLKASEYRLTFKGEQGTPNNRFPVYSFCMCPGGKVVPAAPYPNTNIVNGMSRYLRNSPFANAAVVAGFSLENLLNKELEPLEALQWLQQLEETFFNLSGGYNAPACYVKDFLAHRVSGKFGATSYPFDLFPADFAALFPAPITQSLRDGLDHFCRRLKGFEEGVLMGLESKTSAPIRAIRQEGGLSPRFDNLYIAGEGSGYAGGIVSSAADGIKTALNIISRNH